MADAEGYVGHPFVAGFAVAVEFAFFVPQIAAAAVNVGIPGQSVAQTERANEHIGIAAVFLDFGRNGDKRGCAGLDVNRCGKFGAVVFAIQVGKGSFQFPFALVSHYVFNRQGQVGISG